MQTAPDLGVRLGKLIPRLSSNHDGEVVATARAIGRVLEAEKLDLHDLAAAVVTGFRTPSKAAPAPSPTPSRSRRPKPSPPPSRAPRTPFQQVAMEVLRVALDRLTKRENQFLVSLLEWEGEASDRQLKWLRDLCARFGVEIENG